MTDSTHKTERARFSPWYAQRELSLFASQSRSGWHLVRRTHRELEYEYAPKLQYRYAMDYQAGHREDRYLESFRDDGWEIVGAIPAPFERWACVTLLYHLPPLRPHPAEGCWYIFRKEYDPALTEAEYEIFSETRELEQKRRELTRSYTRLLCPYPFGLWPAGSNLALQLL